MIRQTLHSLLILGILILTPVLKAESMESANFAYITDGLSPLIIRDKRLGYDFLIKRYAKNYNMAITMSYDTNGQVSTKAFQQGELHYIGISYIIAAKLFNSLESAIGDIYLSSQSNAILERQIVLVRKNDSDDFKSFEGKRAVLQENASNSIMDMDLLSMQLLHKRYQDGFKIEYTDTSHRAILQLFFNQADIAFIPLRSWETAKTMNPALEQNLKVIHTSSPVYGYGIEFFSNKASPRLQQISKQANDDLKLTEDGRQLMRIMKAVAREKVTKEHLRSYLKPYVTYQAQLKAFKGKVK